MNLAASGAISAPEVAGAHSPAHITERKAEAAAALVTAAPASESPEDASAWRRELAERLNRYHSRRKPRPPRYPSLRLRSSVDHSADQEDQPVAVNTRGIPVEFPAATPATSTYANHALALETFATEPEHAPASSSPDSSHPQHPSQPASDSYNNPHPPHSTARILEFPRSSHDLWAPPAPRLDELAEPAFLPPRILDVPELVPPPPALGGITIAPAKKPDYEKRPGIDIPLRGASLGRRIFSATLDAAIIAANCALFSFIFWKLTAIRPPRLQIAGVLSGLGIVFWAAYQYLLLVYTGTTPGLRLARLRLARFDGGSASRKLRRWRVLASFLSALSLGMGYVWVFLDEDSLCWHDRITHTYLEENK
jgi:uncharacterized RDD family membrane protein YckC